MSDSSQPPLSAEILMLLGKASEQFEPENNTMKQWIIDHFRNPLLVDLMQDATFTMLRVLDAVGQLEPVNGITISRQYRIPKGSVSKTTRRLIAKKLITREALPNNRKEVLFRTTPLGKELFLAHRAFDQQMERGLLRFLNHYNEDELRFIIRVLTDVSQASFLTLGGEPE